MNTHRAALDGIAQGLELALANVRRLLESPDQDEWVDQQRSPLGRRRHCELARSGAFATARKTDGKWFVRRKEIDAYIESHPGAKPSPSQEEARELGDILAYRAAKRGRQ